jgi:hypothetical protein
LAGDVRLKKHKAESSEAEVWLSLAEFMSRKCRKVKA